LRTLPNGRVCLPSPLRARVHQWLIRGDQRAIRGQSFAISGNQWQSEAISGQRLQRAQQWHSEGTQKQSEANRGQSVVNQWQSVAIGGNQWLLKGTQRHSEAIRGTQTHSDALRRTQTHSDALRRSQRSCKLEQVQRSVCTNLVRGPATSRLCSKVATVGAAAAASGPNTPACSAVDARRSVAPRECMSMSILMSHRPISTSTVMRPLWARRIGFSIRLTSRRGPKGRLGRVPTVPNASEWAQTEHKSTGP